MPTAGWIPACSPSAAHETRTSCNSCLQRLATGYFLFLLLGLMRRRWKVTTHVTQWSSVTAAEAQAEARLSGREREEPRSWQRDGGALAFTFSQEELLLALRQRHGAGLHPCCLQVLRENFPFPPLDRKCNVYLPAEVGTVGLWFKKRSKRALLRTFVVDEIRWHVVQVEQKTFGVHIQVLDVSVRTVSKRGKSACCDLLHLLKVTFLSWQRIHNSAQTHAQRPTATPPPL